MPQADLLSFHPTLLVLPTIFLVGYFFFVTWWAPRIVLTFKARAWLTRYQAVLLLTGVTSPQTWPELVLMAVQFAGLVWLVVGITLVVHALHLRLFSPKLISPAPVTYTGVGAVPTENVFVMWAVQRVFLFLSPGGVDLTRWLDQILGGFGFFAPGKQFFLFSPKLKKALFEQLSRLSGVAAGVVGA